MGEQIFFFSFLYFGPHTALLRVYSETCVEGVTPSKTQGTTILVLGIEPEKQKESGKQKETYKKFTIFSSDFAIYNFIS